MAGQTPMEKAEAKADFEYILKKVKERYEEEKWSITSKDAKTYLNNLLSTGVSSAESIGAGLAYWKDKYDVPAHVSKSMEDSFETAKTYAKNVRFVQGPVPVSPPASSSTGSSSDDSEVNEIDDSSKLLSFRCSVCGAKRSTQSALAVHKRTAHPTKSSNSDDTPELPAGLDFSGFDPANQEGGNDTTDGQKGASDLPAKPVSANVQSTPQEPPAFQEGWLLVKGRGPSLGDGVLEGNGDAVYVVNAKGDKFHVTGQVAQEMQNKGMWKDPVLMDQTEVDAIHSSFALTSAEQVKIVNNKTTGGLFIVKGNGADLGDSQLKDNGAAVYAIDDSGKKLHVTGQAAQEMQGSGTWIEPVVIDQAVLDSTPVAGALAGGSGEATELVVSFEAPAAVSTSPEPTAETPASMPAAIYKPRLVRGNGADLGDSQLKGNGVAVYVLQDDNTLLHVTGQMAQELQAANKWSDPEPWNQSDIDSRTVVGSLASVDGGVAGLVVPIEAPVAAAPVPELAPPLPAGPPPVQTDERQAVWHSNDATTNFRLIKGNGPSMGDEVYNNGDAVFALNAKGEKFHITGALAGQMIEKGLWSEPEVHDQGLINAIPNGSDKSMTTMAELRTMNIEDDTEFKLMKGNGADLGHETLEGNGAAVYAVTRDGDRYHVKGELAAKMQQDGTWGAVEELSQTEIDSMKPVKGSLSTYGQLNNAVANDYFGGDGSNGAMPAGVPPQIYGGK